MVDNNFGLQASNRLTFSHPRNHFLAQLSSAQLKSNMFPSFAVSDRRGQRRDRLRERAEEGEAAAAAQGQRRQGLRDEKDPPRQDREARRYPAGKHARPGKLK